MSATGTIDGIQYRDSKAGKQYGKVSIDGQEYLVFGKTLEQLRRAKQGDTVEFSAKPTDSGDGQLLTFLKVVGGGSVATKQSVANNGNFGTRPPPSRSNDPNIQLSIFYGYAKDLVANGIVKTPVWTPASAADLISTTAKELMRRFTQDTSGTPEPEPVETETANPL